MKRIETLLLIVFFFSPIMSGYAQPEIVRGPYLQKGSSTSIVVKWQTDVATASILKYGTSPGNFATTLSSLGNTKEHEVEISLLNPNTKYYYQLHHSSGTFNNQQDQDFITAPIPGTQQPIRAWVLGDCGTANNNQRDVRDAYYNYVASRPATDDHTDMILLLGDNAYNDGEQGEYQDAIFENMYEDILKKSVTWSCLGNHDGRAADASSQSGPYFDIFTFPENGECGGVASGTEAYYSYDYGNVHFIVLESYETDRSVGGAMYNWCQADLQNTTADWIVAFWHHPPYTRGSHNSDIELQLFQMRQNFLPLLEDYGVDLVLNGHSHSYERTYLLKGHHGLSFSFDKNDHTVGPTGDGDGKADGDGAYQKTSTGPTAGDGAVYITAGSSGKTSGGLLNHPAMVTSLNELGSCVLEINRDTLNLKFLRENGAVDDYFTIIKAGLTTSGPGSITITQAPTSLTIPCDSPSDVSVTGDLLASTNCAQGGLTINHTDALFPASCGQNYFISRTFSVADACGNTETHIQTIIVQDAVAPVISCSISIDTLLANGANIPAVPDYSNAVTSITDNCLANPTFWQSPEVGSMLIVGDHFINLIATDSCGHFDTCKISLSIIDTATTTPTSISSFGASDNGPVFYPNPAKNLLVIERGTSTEKTTMEILTTGGRAVLNKSIETGTHQEDISSLEQGVYFIHFKTASSLLTRKLIILR